MPLFLDHLPFEACARIWDVMVLEGDSFLYRAALGIFAVLEPRLFFPDRQELQRPGRCIRTRRAAPAERLGRTGTGVRGVHHLRAGALSRQHVAPTSALNVAAATRLFPSHAQGRQALPCRPLCVDGMAHAYVSLTAVNVFNKPPPFSFNPDWYDYHEYDIRGRYLRLSIGARF